MNRHFFLLLVIITTSLMGSSFTIGKIGLQYVSSILLVGLRFTIAGALMALILFKKPKPKVLKEWLKIGTIGLFQTAGVMGCIFLSLQTITAGESSILTFLNPLLVVIFGSLFLKMKYHFSQWFGVIVGFLGVAITLGLHLQIKTGTFLGLGAAISWAIATLLIKRWGNKLDVWILTAYQMLFGGIILLIFSFLFEDIKFISQPTTYLVILWLAIMASIVQFAIWFYLLNKNDPGKTSSFLFLAPFFGVLSGWLILGEKLSISFVIGGSLILLGIYLVNWPIPFKIFNMKPSSLIHTNVEVSHAIYAVINPDGSTLDIPEDDSNKAEYYIMLEKVLKTGEIKKTYKGKYGQEYEQWPESVKSQVNKLVKYLEENIEGFPEEGMNHIERIKN